MIKTMGIETKVNVLVLCMSTINGRLKLNYYYNHYKGKENFYGCVGQLEPACKAIIDRLDGDMTCKQKLRIVVLNTEETANEVNNDRFKIQAPDNVQYASAYDFFVFRIESYVAGKENDKNYEVGKEEIDSDMKMAIDNIIDGICNYDGKGQLSEECENIDGLKKIIDNKNSCDLIAYSSEIKRVLKKEIESRLEQRYKLNDRESALLEREEESRDYLAELKKGEESQIADKRIRDFFETLKSREDEFTDIKNKEEKIEKEIKNSNDDSYAFEMISSLEKRYKKLRIWYKVQLVGLNDIYQKQVLSNKIEKLTEQYEKAITDLQNREMELFGIIQKLQRQLDDIKKRYQNTVLQYLHDELWKKIVLTSSQSAEKKKSNVEIEQWVPITVRRNIDDKIEEIVNAIKGDDTEMPRVFVDTQGGYRDNVMILASIMEMLKVSGISTEDTYAVNFNFSNFANEIITNTDKYKMFDMVSGMDEFLGYMHISKLMGFLDNRYQGIFGNDHNKSAEEKKVREQVESAISEGKKFFMNKLKFISEHMLLCHVDSIDKELTEFEKEYSEWFEHDNNNYASIKMKLLGMKEGYGGNKNIIEYIEDILSYLELFSFAMRNIKIHFLDKVIMKDASGNIYIELPNLIEWCIEREMIQQALTLAEDKTVDYLFEKGAIKFPVIEIETRPEHIKYAYQKTKQGRFLCDKKKYLFEGFGLDLVNENLFTEKNTLYCGERKYNCKNIKNLCKEITEEIKKLIKFKNNYNFMIGYLNKSGVSKKIIEPYIGKGPKQTYYLKNHKNLPGIMYVQMLEGCDCKYNATNDDKEKLSFLAFAMLHAYIKKQRNHVNHGQEEGLDMESMKKLLKFYIEVLKKIGYPLREGVNH